MNLIKPTVHAQELLHAGEYVPNDEKYRYVVCFVLYLEGCA